MTWKMWLLATRPKTLWAAIAPVFLGGAMAYGDGYFSPVIFIVVLFSAVMIQIGTNFANDYYDYIKGADTKERMGPTRATQAGWLTPKAMKKAFIFIFFLAFLSGLYLAWQGGIVILIIGIVSIFCGIIYTGGPFPLGYNGLGDIFVFIFFGPVAVGGTYYLQRMDIEIVHLVCGCALGSLATAIIIVNNLRDIETDKKANKKTLAVRFGTTFTYCEYITCIAFAFIVPLYLFIMKHKGAYIFLAFLPLPFAFYLIIEIIKKSGKELNPVLGKTALLLLVYSMTFSFAWILS